MSLRATAKSQGCNDGRQRGGCLGRLPNQRGHRDLPDHAVARTWASWPTSGRPRARRTSGARCPRSSRCRARAAPPARCTARCRAGALTTTFTASQGLLLMIPNMYKIAGELTLHGLPRRGARRRHARRCRSSATTATSWPRAATGWAMLASNTVQEAWTWRSSRRPPRSSRASRSCTSSTASAPRTRCRRSSSSPTTTCAP